MIEIQGGNTPIQTIKVGRMLDRIAGERERLIAMPPDLERFWGDAGLTEGQP